MFVKYLYIFAISMVPIIELRGAVPIGIGLGLNPLLTLVVAIIGNMVPVPFILIFIRKIFAWMKTWGGFWERLVNKLEIRADKKGDAIRKYASLGLLILVAIPLPGTGAWTGSLVAALFDIKMKKAIPIILLGVIIAGIIMISISYGFSILIS